MSPGCPRVWSMRPRIEGMQVPCWVETKLLGCPLRRCIDALNNALAGGQWAVWAVPREGGIEGSVWHPESVGLSMNALRGVGTLGLHHMGVSDKSPAVSQQNVHVGCVQAAVAHWSTPAMVIYASHSLTPHFLQTSVLYLKDADAMLQLCSVLCDHQRTGGISPSIHPAGQKHS